MNLLVLADSHGRDIEAETKPDVMFLLGDMDFYQIRRLDEAFDCPKFGVLGNHDGPDFYENTSIQNVHGRAITWNGIRIGGLEGAPFYNKRKYLQYTEQEAKEVLHGMGKCDILLSHSNPMLVPSFDTKDSHRGFQALTDYLMEYEPRFLFHGHTHKTITKPFCETTIHSVYGAKTYEIEN